MTHAQTTQCPPRSVHVIVWSWRQVLIACGVQVGVAVGVIVGVAVMQEHPVPQRGSSHTSTSSRPHVGCGNVPRQIGVLVGVRVSVRVFVKVGPSYAHPGGG